MLLPLSLIPLLLPLLPTSTLARKPPEKILLSNVKTLTLRQDQKTAHNRVSPVQQLTCHGAACDLYQVDILRCKNQGADYSPEDIQWTCTASLPPEFKLGSTDVVCEGFGSSDDPYILKGSCGVDYRLLLTEQGEKRYGRLGGRQKDGRPGGGYDEGKTKAEELVTGVFWVFFVCVVLLILYGACASMNPGRAQGEGRPWGGGGDGGGGDDAPPPYSQYPSQSKTVPGQQGQDGWRPGFWSGAVGGAAAGYYAGSRGRDRGNDTGDRGGGMWAANDNGEGSSNWGSGRTSSRGQNSFSSSRHESSGFGSTGRR